MQTSLRPKTKVEVVKGASGAISGVLGIAAAVGNRSAYYWLIIQIVFAICVQGAD
jgi:membrane associated rhomboid family serine protease